VSDYILKLAGIIGENGNLGNKIITDLPAFDRKMHAAGYI
jgi:hypothetical protein